MLNIYQGCHYEKINKILFVTILLLTLTVGLTLSSSTAFASSYNDYANDDYETALMSSSTIAPPNVEYRQAYNMVVKYDWTVGAGGDKLEMSRNFNYFESNGVRYIVYQFPNNLGSKNCDPEYFRGRSCLTSTNEYSEVTSLEHLVKISDSRYETRYGYDCKYIPVGRFEKAQIVPENKIPTSYNVEKFYWYHTGGTGQTIKATIEYDGVLGDISLKIPLLGYKTASVTIDGITFALRTGPKKCSLKVDRSDLPAWKLNFAFGLS